jgi:hypothetical protein
MAKAGAAETRERRADGFRAAIPAATVTIETCRCQTRLAKIREPQAVCSEAP